MDNELATWTNVTMRIIEEQKQLTNNPVPKTEESAKLMLIAKRNGMRRAKNDIICWECK